MREIYGKNWRVHNEPRDQFKGIHVRAQANRLSHKAAFKSQFKRTQATDAPYISSVHQPNDWNIIVQESSSFFKRGGKSQTASNSRSRSRSNLEESKIKDIIPTKYCVDHHPGHPVHDQPFKLHFAKWK